MKPESVVCILGGAGGEPDSSQAGKSQSGKGVLRVPEAGLDKRTLRLPVPEAGGLRVHERGLSLFTAGCLLRVRSPRGSCPPPLPGMLGRLGSPPECPRFTFINSLKAHGPNSPI